MDNLPSTSQKNLTTVLQNHEKNTAKDYIYFKFLESHSVGVLQKVPFNKRCTALVPDIYLILTFVVAVLSATAANHIFIAVTLFKDHKIYGLLFVLFFFMNKLFTSGFFVLRSQYRKKKKVEGAYRIKLNPCKFILSIISIILGLDSLLIGFKLLKIVLNSSTVLDRTKITPFYQLSDVKLSTMKIYLLIAVVTKSIPEIHIAAILLMFKIADNVTILAAQLVILTNWITISLALAISLPLKRSATVFKNSNLVLLTSFSKFMAIMSLNAVNIIYFRNLFQHLKFYSLLVYMFKFGVIYGIFLENASYYWNLETKKFFVIYGLGLAIIYIIAYIHPVQTKGRLAYYFYYCFKFVSDLAIIYLSSEDYSFLMDYLVLSLVSIGFLSLTFGLSALFEA